MCNYIQSKGCVWDVCKASRKQNALITVQRNMQDSVPSTDSLWYGLWALDSVFTCKCVVSITLGKNPVNLNFLGSSFSPTSDHFFGHLFSSAT